MRPVTCVFDTDMGANLVRADGLDRSWLNSVQKRDIPEMRSSFNANSFLSGASRPPASNQ